MEALLKLSGVLSEDNGKTDLGTLERRLADKTNGTSSASPALHPGDRSGSLQAYSSAGSREATPTRNGSASNSHSVAVTPEPAKRSEEVEALSDMMCSLVTNNCGETKYIGATPAPTLCQTADFQAPRPASPSSRPRASSGSAKRPATTRSSP